MNFNNKASMYIEPDVDDVIAYKNPQTNTTGY